MKQHPADPEEGSATVETVIIAPLLMLLAMFVIGLGRMTQAQLLAQTAAGSAARAASLTRTPEGAIAAARAAAVDAGSGSSCPNPTVTVDTSAFHPGGTVAVRVQCRPTLADLTGVGFPGSVTIGERVVSGIDTWRQASTR